MSTTWTHPQDFVRRRRWTGVTPSPATRHASPVTGEQSR
jgi:hypothetical protein